MSAQVDQIGSDAASMAETAEELADLMRRFKLDQDGQAETSRSTAPRQRAV